MFKSIIKKLLKLNINFYTMLQRVNIFEHKISLLSNESLRIKTSQFKHKICFSGNVNSILFEALAVIRETSKRIIGERPHDVQIIAAISLCQGTIIEMKTGEGKTLVAALAAYVNTLWCNTIHIVTVNDYLASRDNLWMKPIFAFHGLSVGHLSNNTSFTKRKSLYYCNVLYGTNNEFAFDYLRDNLKYSCNNVVQKSLNFAIIDEVDSILIDEARTPLIISDTLFENNTIYKIIDNIVSKLNLFDYEIDKKNKNVSFTEKGNDKIEFYLKKNNIIKQNTNLYVVENISIIHYLYQSIKAHKLFILNKDYIIINNQINIIDEFTGRIMNGRRYSDNLHQAIEAKENILIQKENQTLASITFQNYFRMYNIISGMTGTAMTEKQEFLDIYNIRTIKIPTNNYNCRKDENDLIYQNTEIKYKKIIQEIEKTYNKKQPILIGTISIEKSEYISSLLFNLKIKHNTLNAKYHNEEAKIISQAGQSGNITISTNMAGRGTDIQLGGNAQVLIYFNSIKKEIDNISKNIYKDKQYVLSLGGLYIIGTERHESRRIDDQLRGRSGRQGDLGNTRFFISLQDELMKVFGSENIIYFLNKIGLKECDSIEHKWINKSIYLAQKKVELHNFNIRKNLLEFDDVINEQRMLIYLQRQEIIEGKSFFDIVKTKFIVFNQNIISQTFSNKFLLSKNQFDILKSKIYSFYNINIVIKNISSYIDINKIINNFTLKIIYEKKQKLGEKLFNNIMRKIFLINLDQLWKEHLHTIDKMKIGINLRSYGYKDPLKEYKSEALNLFKNMLLEYEQRIVFYVSRIQLIYTLKKIS